jgi:hypothetical protein
MKWYSVTSPSVINIKVEIKIKYNLEAYMFKTSRHKVM